MKAKISLEGDFTVVELSGYLDFESARPIEQSIKTIYDSNSDAKVLIDLVNLEFVGSSGVSSFVKGLRVFNSLKMKPFYFGVKSEFLRLFRAFEQDKPFEVLQDKQAAYEAALERYKHWEMTTNRSKRTH
jgi:anti-anti-sigma factor